jgi:hypothetical protein
MHKDRHTFAHLIFRKKERRIAYTEGKKQLSGIVLCLSELQVLSGIMEIKDKLGIHYY